MSGLDLIKKVELVLEKKGFSSEIVARVGIVIDESGSMDSLFRTGFVSKTVDRVLAIGYKFDDNGEIDVWSFSNRFKRRPPAKQEDYGSYIKHHLLGGSTLYHPVLQDVADFYFKGEVTVTGKLFGLIKKVVKTEGSNEPVFIAFITDGMPDSDYEAISEVSRILRNHPNMFIQFIGVGHSRFDVLQKLADENDNAAFATINPLDSDEDVLDKFLNEKARKVLEAK